MIEGNTQQRKVNEDKPIIQQQQITPSRSLSISTETSPQSSVLLSDSHKLTTSPRDHHQEEQMAVESTTRTTTSIASSFSRILHLLDWSSRVLSEQVFTHRVMNVLKSLSMGSIFAFAVLKLLEWWFSHSVHQHHRSANVQSRSLLQRSPTSPFQQLKSLREHSLYKSPHYSNISSDHPIPRSQKGRFYLHELSTWDELGASTDNRDQSKSSSRSNVISTDGPLFVPLSRIEKFQQLQQQEKTLAPKLHELDQNLQNNALYGQMAQLESYRKSTIFGE
ncbi:hypothetical protein FDP41_001202 [Naegleria fowleri]|uniref:Uncharacterized protein n=1 Tax=Naegleria fowleri TaxID=5763 RepID=A0A6A5C426_NAEFO|nr:uncharacterized protein FDP41_001202 [Naegleria fowleri]KAF0980049.1 hypothetical protein FDP41_001202 [Naegleria fowleri]